MTAVAVAVAVPGRDLSPSGHGERAALRHGIASVDGQVHHDLREFVRIDFDRQRFFGKISFDLDVCAQQTG